MMKCQQVFMGGHRAEITEAAAIRSAWDFLGPLACWYLAGSHAQTFRPRSTASVIPGFWDLARTESCCQLLVAAANEESDPRESACPA